MHCSRELRISHVLRCDVSIGIKLCMHVVRSAVLQMHSSNCSTTHFKGTSPFSVLDLAHHTYPSQVETCTHTSGDCFPPAHHHHHHHHLIASASFLKLSVLDSWASCVRPSLFADGNWSNNGAVECLLRGALVIHRKNGTHHRAVSAFRDLPLHSNCATVS